tara:strand:+ start:17304 stop:19475 length:2172 start_codon:yes stop_codon:yes gene_type:complete
MSNLLFTGEVAIPDIKGSVRDLSTILQNNTILQQKQLELQAKQTAATQKRRSEVMKSLYGEGLSGVHEAALPFVRQALDEVALQIDPLLDQEGGDLLAQRMIRNALDSVARYQDDDAWHVAEQNLIALSNPESLEYAEANKALGPAMRPTLIQDPLALSDRARGRGVRDMSVKVDASGNFTIGGVDMNETEYRPIEQMSWWNSANLFDGAVGAVSVEEVDVIAQGRAYTESFKERKPWKREEATQYFNNLVYLEDGGFKPLDMMQTTGENEEFQLRISAYANDRLDILSEFPTLNDVSLQRYYELREEDFVGKPRLRMRIEKSINDTIKRIVDNSDYDFDAGEPAPPSTTRQISDAAQVDIAPDFENIRDVNGLIVPFLPGERRTVVANVSEFQTKEQQDVNIAVPNPAQMEWQQTIAPQIQAAIQEQQQQSSNPLAPEQIKEIQERFPEEPDRIIDGKLRDISVMDGEDRSLFLTLEGEPIPIKIDLNSNRGAAVRSALIRGFTQQGQPTFDLNKLYDTLARRLTPTEQATPAPRASASGAVVLPATEAPTDTVETENFMFNSGAPGEQGGVEADEVADDTAVATDQIPEVSLAQRVETELNEPLAVTGAQRDLQEKNVQRREEARQNLEALAREVREDFNISPFVSRQARDNQFTKTLQEIVQDEKFLNALIDEGYKDALGLLGVKSKRREMMLSALEKMTGNEKAEYLRKWIQTNSDRLT